MIRELRTSDHDAAIRIVNDNWKREYANYINPLLLTEDGCHARAGQMKRDFQSGRLSEYVWEEDGKVLALLSIGPTADEDKADSFEIWRVYIDPAVQGRGIGGKLIAFGEQMATERGYREIVIWAFRENKRAVSFYQKHGYEPDKEEFIEEPYRAWGIRLIKQI